jgi:hypothetical protein
MNKIWGFGHFTWNMERNSKLFMNAKQKKFCTLQANTQLFGIDAIPRSAVQKLFVLAAHRRRSACFKPWFDFTSDIDVYSISTAVKASPSPHLHIHQLESNLIFSMFSLKNISSDVIKNFWLLAKRPRKFLSRSLLYQHFSNLISLINISSLMTQRRKENETFNLKRSRDSITFTFISSHFDEN